MYVDNQKRGKKKSSEINIFGFTFGMPSFKSTRNIKVHSYSQQSIKSESNAQQSAMNDIASRGSVAAVEDYEEEKPTDPDNI